MPLSHRKYEPLSQKKKCESLHVISLHRRSRNGHSTCILPQLTLFVDKTRQYHVKLLCVLKLPRLFLSLSKKDEKICIPFGDWGCHLDYSDTVSSIDNNGDGEFQEQDSKITDAELLNDGIFFLVQYSCFVTRQRSLLKEQA